MCIHVRLSQQRQAKIIILKLCIAVAVTVTLEAKHQELWFISTGNLYQSHTNNMIGNMDTWTHHKWWRIHSCCMLYVQKGNHRNHKHWKIQVACLLYMQKGNHKWHRMQSQILQSESRRMKQRF